MSHAGARVGRGHPLAGTVAALGVALAIVLSRPVEQALMPAAMG